MTNTRLWTVPALVFAVSMFGAGIGCGETGGGMAGSGGTGGAGGSGGAAGSEAPVITKVQWDWADDPCDVDTTSAVTVTVFATDDDTDSGSLVYSGSVSDCTPVIEADFSLLDCTPGIVGRRSGTVTVTDPENNSDTVSFGFFACESDEVCEGGDPCE